MGWVSYSLVVYYKDISPAGVTLLCLLLMMMMMMFRADCGFEPLSSRQMFQ